MRVFVSYQKLYLKKRKHFGVSLFTRCVFMVQKTMCLSDLCSFMKERYHAIVSLRYVQGIRSAVSPER